MPRKIDTLSDLSRTWKSLISGIGRDLALAGRLASDPLKTLRELGYEVSPEAARALQQSLP